jgi:hypothetical protein
MLIDEGSMHLKCTRDEALHQVAIGGLHIRLKAHMKRLMTSRRLA